MATKVVYKYSTGHPVPLNAKYLCTQVETYAEHTTAWGGGVFTANKFVWHYYEVEIDEKGDPK